MPDAKNTDTVDAAATRSDATTVDASRASKKADKRAAHARRRRVTWKGTYAWVGGLAGANRDARRGARLGFWATVTFLLVGALIAVAGLVYSVRGLNRAGSLGGRKGAFAGLALNGLVLSVNIVLVAYAGLWYTGRDDTTPVAATEPPAVPAPAESSPAPEPSGTPSSTTAFTGQCTAIRLELPDELRADRYRPVAFMGGETVTDLDPTGRYAVGTIASGRGSAIVVWDRGEARSIPVDGQIRAVGVNSQGTVVGYTLPLRRDGRGETPWVHAGTMVELAIPSGYDAARATAVNDHGDVVGVATNRRGASAAVIWTIDTQYAPRTLDAPGIAAAHGIASDGTVVGRAGVGAPSRGAPGRGQPYAWAPDGTGRALTLPDGESSGEVVRVRGEWAAGIAWHVEREGRRSADVEYVGVRWNLRTGEMSTYPSRWGQAPVVNGHGDVIEVAGDRGRSGTAVLHRDGQEYELPTEGRRDYPVALSDDATVILGAHVAPGGAGGVGVMWRC